MSASWASTVLAMRFDGAHGASTLIDLKGHSVTNVGATIAKDFPDQRAARDFMRETAAMPYRFYSQETCVPGKDFGPYDENTFIPRFKKTESIKFFVSGGPGKQSQIWVPFPQVFKPVSKKIAE